MKGEFQRFSEGKLLVFFKLLDAKVILHIRPRHQENQYSETAISR